MGKVKTTSPQAPAKTMDLSPVALGLVVLCIALIRLRLVGIPLERDEGEYALMGKSLLEGIAPYKEAYSMKLPGTYFMYAMIMKVFGATISGVHYGLLLVNVTTVILLFLGLKKLYNSPVALLTSGVYGLMSLSAAVLGFAAHATHFVTLFVAAGLYVLSRYYEKSTLFKAFLAGLMFGLSFLMKQQAMFFMIFGGLALILPGLLEKPRKYKPLVSTALIYGAGSIIPYAVTVALLISAGVFEGFWLWTVRYAGTYAAGAPLPEGLGLFWLSFAPLWKEFTLFWVLFVAGAVSLFLTEMPRRQKLVAVLFAFFSFLSICPGLYFRKHYFIAFLPAVALLGALGTIYLTSLLVKLKTNSFAYLPFLIFLLASIVALSKGKGYYFEAGPNEISLAIYKKNPFIESVEIAKYIHAHSAPTDKMAVVGSEPQIYLYADRRPVTGYIYTYGLMENQKYNKTMQQEMISEIEKGKPEFLVYCNMVNSWLARPDSPTLIFEWVNAFVQQYYEIVGIVDFVGDRSFYAWNADAKAYAVKGRENILVFKRKSDGNSLADRGGSLAAGSEQVVAHRAQPEQSEISTRAAGPPSPDEKESAPKGRRSRQSPQPE